MIFVLELTVIESENPDSIMGSEGLAAKMAESSIEDRGKRKVKKKTKNNSIWQVFLIVYKIIIFLIFIVFSIE